MEKKLNFFSEYKKGTDKNWKEENLYLSEEMVE